MDGEHRDRASRASFIRNAAAAGAGLVLAGTGGGTALADDVIAGSCSDSIQTIINTALIAEQLATTFYYTGLTSPTVMSNTQLGGSSIDPNKPGLPPDGNPGNVRYLQAALDAEMKHAAMLAKAGGKSQFTQFFFPQGTFSLMGTSTNATTFLGVLDTLETAFVGAYLAAVSQFVTLGRPALAELAASIMGVESEHRALGRSIANVNPANNLTLEKAPFGCGSDAARALNPFLTGVGFAAGATQAIAMPTQAQAAQVIGKYGTRLVKMYL